MSETKEPRFWTVLTDSEKDICPEGHEVIATRRKWANGAVELECPVCKQGERG